MPLRAAGCGPARGSDRGARNAVRSRTGATYDARVTLPILVGPSTVTINRNDRFLVCQPDGRIASTRRRASSPGTPGSCPAGTCSQRSPAGPPQLVARWSSSRRVSSSRTTALIDDEGPVERHTISDPRWIARSPGGIHEDLDLDELRPARRAPHDRDRDRVGLRRHLRRQGRDASSGAATINSRWFRSRRELRTTYVNRDFRRELVVAVDRRTRRRSSPTGGWSSSPRSRPRATGTPACAGCR